MQRLLLLSLLLVGLRPSSSQTNSQDVAALQALMKNWQNVPQNWTGTTDPCTSWDGISCSNGRVTKVKLPSINLQGTVSTAIDQLAALTYLDLSNNPNLGGPLTPNIGKLKQLTTLNLQGCSFTGNIPNEIGNLTQLTFLALNSNNFTGGIPPTLGHLSNLFLLDLTANQLSGQIPVSTSSTPGLDQLVSTKHFHFGENQLIGPISESLFNANMTLIHVYFQNNKFTGPIPESLGLVQTLEMILLDKNQFSGLVPKSIGNLGNLMELNLASNLLSGTVPDLSNATQLNYLDLSNNNFASSPAPGWFSTLTSLNTLLMDNDGLTGTIPSALFSLPQLLQVSLANNTLNGTLSMRSNISSLLRVVNLTNNQIIEANVDPGYNISLILTGNPICLDDTSICKPKQQQQGGLGLCGDVPCPHNQSAYPATSQNSASTRSSQSQGSMIFIVLIMYSLLF
ncbi:unnamed protein product [Urochloa decumbens]|uniref:Leucine-rich repeat-containing N-terminal plant-type domain-containing protein n=1 Tax=Urochloa decumbens TaxID=240449 RepID=A0ABC8YPL8_9POAL